MLVEGGEALVLDVRVEGVEARGQLAQHLWTPSGHSGDDRPAQSGGGV